MRASLSFIPIFFGDGSSTRRRSESGKKRLRGLINASLRDYAKNRFAIDGAHGDLHFLRAIMTLTV